VGDQASVIVWERRVDHARHQRWLRNFWMYYGLPAAVLIIVVGIFVGIGEASGVLILLGLLGGMVYVTLWLSGRNERTNSNVTREGNELVWGQRRVPIDQVTAFSTFKSEASMRVSHATTPGGVKASASLGNALFLLVDGAEVGFVFPSLDDEQLGELRAALEQVMPGRWTKSIRELRNV